MTKTIATVSDLVEVLTEQPGIHGACHFTHGWGGAIVEGFVPEHVEDVFEQPYIHGTLDGVEYSVAAALMYDFGFVGK